MRQLSLIGLLMLASSLQGCFPIVAAGMGTGVVVAKDPRTNGTYLEDEEIQLKSAKAVGDKYGDRVHVNITSYNRVALVTGEVPDEASKAEIGKMVAATQNVRNVNNELAVSGLSSLTSRSSDALVTSDIKLHYVGKENFDSGRVKIVTENGTVYLMGLVSHEEGKIASDIASSTSGVLRVVTFFEYTN
ncbi:MAG TPA: BON domain-containing protein [Gallionella sp.]|nr:BON domain-containing protein [Gallionella sp.]